MAKYVNKNLKEILIFLVLGGITTALNMLLLAIFKEILLINYLVANVLSYLISVITSYFLNVFITFKKEIQSKKEEIKKLISFCIMKILLLVVDTICLFILVQKFGINLYVSKIILIFLLTLFSFNISKKIIS